MQCESTGIMRRITMDNKSKILITIETVALICLAIVLGLYVSGATKPAGKTSAGTAPESLEHDGYTLEQVVVLSRHNIRSPLVGGDSVLSAVTPHKWFAWTSPASQLSVRGGTLETSMGQYFRKWLESESLFPENYHPEKGAVRIYANSKQRTIATAEFFSAGLLPTVNENVETHADFDTMDPVFNPCLTYVSDGYKKAVQDQIKELYTDEIEDLEDNYALVSKVIDMDKSSGARDGTVKPFRTDDTKVTLEAGKEPAMEGSLKTACSVSDAMTLQYYEEADPVKAAFGNDLSQQQWTEIADIKDVYNDVLFTAPLVADNIANPLLREIDSEMNAEGRRFTFLCGHDSNIASVLAALDADEYDLPDTIEKKAPIGVKLVFSKWKAANGAEYWDVDMVYQTTAQLRNAEILTADNHPASVDISFNGLDQNADSLYTDGDLKARFRESIGEYDKLASY